MFGWLVHSLLILAVVAQGGCLRACQLQRMIVGDTDDDARTTVMSADDSASDASLVPGDSDSKPQNDKSPNCPCEFRKGLAQPDRAGYDFQFLAVEVLVWTPVVLHLPVASSATTVPSHLPVGRLISHSPPLLI